MKRPTCFALLMGSLLLASAFAQSDARACDEAPVRAPAVSTGAHGLRVGDEAGVWLRRMLAAEPSFAFDVPAVERSMWPAAVDAPPGGFAWPAGATLALIRANFDVRWAGRERIAGETVAVIGLLPRHDGPEWRFWIDVATGARVGYRATLRGGRVFAEGRGDPTTLTPTDSGAALRAPEPPRGARGVAWRTAFGGLAGFEPVAVERVRLGSGVPALSVTLWDGLTGVVLYVYPVARAPARLEGIVVRSVGALTLALAGPVPEATAAAYLDALGERRWARTDVRSLLQEWAPDVDDAERDGVPGSP